MLEDSSFRIVHLCSTVAALGAQSYILVNCNPPSTHTLGKGGDMLFPHLGNLICHHRVRVVPCITPTVNCGACVGTLGRASHAKVDQQLLLLLIYFATS